MSVEVTGINKPAEIDRKENLREHTLDEAKCLADKILSGYDYKRNDNYFEQEYYGKLRRKIEQELRI